MNSTKAALIAILTSISIMTNDAMMPLFNVKLMDLIGFVGGFCFGPVVGALIGIVSWGVYGSLNPFGFSLPIWFATMFSEALYGVVGAFVGKSLDLEGLAEFKDNRVTVCVFFAVVGMFLTFVYDLITNIVFGYVSGWSVLFAVIVGFVPFGFVHMLSNAIFFGIGCVPAIRAINRIRGGENSGFPKK